MRSTLAFALLALLLSLLLSIVTYELSRRYLLHQRQNLATRQVMANALVVNGRLGGATESYDPLAALQALSNARAIIRDDGDWYSAVVELTEASVPRPLAASVRASGAARQLIEVGGDPYLVIGTKLGREGVEYYEFVSLREYQRTLETLLYVLVGAASLTTALGATAGWLVSRQIMRPLRAVADAAQAMSAGDLSRRLVVENDPDLTGVAASFNEMAANLEARIERESRFTSDVSHELRTPLTALASAVSLVQRSAVDDRARIGVEILDEQVAHLRRLTDELIEISRIDAGVADVRFDDVDVERSTRKVMADLDIDETVLHAFLGNSPRHRLDRHRFERVVANLLENAKKYAGGPVAVTLQRDGGALVLIVDDAGPGIEPAERTAVFGRFHRGTVEDPPGQPKGTGLGLALVDEHVRLHGGSVGVEPSPWGGARFVAVFPEES